MSHPHATVAATGVAQPPAGAVPAPGALLPTASGPAPAAAPAPTTRARPPRSTPQRLQLLSSGVVVLGVLLALVGVLTFALLAVGLDRARADTEQLVRVQSIQTDLLRADATATNAFLVGGLEPAAQRAAYDQAMSSSSARIAEAAQAQPADAAALAVLNQQILDYDAGIEQARANNRQGFPVGAQYLRLASAQLRSSALPVLDELVAANAERADRRMGVGGGYIFPVLCLLAVVGLVLAQLWLARRFHRRVNPGLLAATLVLLLALVGALVGMAALSAQVRDTRIGSFADVNAAARARIWANDAKANESLTLVARGSGQAFDRAWTESGEVVTSELRVLGQPALTDAWRRYGAVHAAVRRQDDAGQWDQAVRQATGTAPDSANASFGALDDGLARAVQEAGATTTARLGGERPGLVVAALLSLLAGLAAALLGRRGVAARLREYR